MNHDEVYQTQQVIAAAYTAGLRCSTYVLSDSELCVYDIVQHTINHVFSARIEEEAM
jgi:hypothetical protein